MNLITVANQKGGCAKTTTVINLASCLVELGKKVLIVDLDPQSNSSHWLNNGVANEFGSFQLLTDKQNITELIIHSPEHNLDLISGSQGLAMVDKLLSGTLSAEMILKRRISKLSTDSYDYILVDTPPTLGLLTINALTAASHVLIPVTTHVMTLSGVAQLINTVNEIQEFLNPDLEILGFLASRVDLRTRHAIDVLDMLKTQFRDQVFKTVIRENVRLAEAPSFFKSITNYDKNSTSAADYRNFAKELVQKIEVK